VPKQKKRRKIGLLEMGAAVKMNVDAAEFPQVEMRESSGEEEEEDDDDKDDGLPRLSKKSTRNRTQPLRFSVWKSAVRIRFVSSSLNSNLTSLLT